VQEPAEHSHVVIQLTINKGCLDCVLEPQLRCGLRSESRGDRLPSHIKLSYLDSKAPDRCSLLD
jgi:hypothetical protein